jgi:cation diffusion facilitator CzcD-associated flavoprotein CzcO
MVSVLRHQSAGNHQLMNITLDFDRFDKLQMRVLEEVITSIRDGLREAGMTDDQILREATGNIAFSVAAIFDGSRVMGLDGEQVFPILTFAKERNSPDLIGTEAGSWMHEYVFGIVDEIFEVNGEG